jgi:tryptophan synthase alpha chain
VAEGADGVVVGSALIDALKNTLDGKDRATAGTIEAVTKLVKELSDGVRSVAKRAAA